MSSGCTPKHLQPFLLVGGQPLLSPREQSSWELRCLYSEHRPLWKTGVPHDSTSKPVPK